MARRLRVDVPGVPQHVIQRGVNRTACFCDELDYRFYLATLEKMAIEHDCRIHAYVLMTNHVHLLATGDFPGGLSRMMQGLGRRYVRQFNDRHHRTGTLWEGRFKSCLVDTERYVLTCYRYIEMNPVRAGIVSHPLDYIWSSIHTNAGDRNEEMLDPHPIYAGLATEEAERKACYRDLLSQAITEDEVARIRRSVNQGSALGSRAFQKQIEALTGRPTGFRRRGRPRK